MNPLNPTTIRAHVDRLSPEERGELRATVERARVQLATLTEPPIRDAFSEAISDLKSDDPRVVERAETIIDSILDSTDD